MKKVLLLLAAILLWAGSSWAVTVQVGSGTSTNSYMPLYTCYGYNYSQQIYLASEITAGGGGGGAITKVRFFYSSGGTTFANWTSWAVYIGNTSKTTFTSTTDWVPVGSMTQVFNGNIPTPVAGTWLELTLSTSFTWDGTSNIVVAVDENSPSYSCTAYWRSFASGSNRAILYYSDGTNPNPASPPAANVGPTATLSQVQFEMQPLTTPALYVVPGTLAFGYTPVGTPTASQTYVLSGSNMTAGPISITAPTGFQVCTDNASWAGTASVTYTPPTLANTTIYVRFNPATANQTYSGNVTNAGGGAPTVNVAVTGSTYMYAKYCTSNATSTADEDISNVTLGTLNNSSTCLVAAPGPGSILNEYSNWTTTVAPPDLSRTSTYAFSVTQTTCGGAYSNAMAIFIDYNQNGVFTDPGEEVYNSATYTSGSHTEPGNITIPVGALLGNTMMRVIDVETTLPTSIVPCGTYSWGETEDYLVNITAAPACPAPANLLATPHAYTADIAWTETGTATSWDVEWGPTPFTPTGNPTPGYGALTNPYVTLPGLTPVTGYAYYVRARCNANSLSPWSGPLNFTTTCAPIQATWCEHFDLTTIPVCWSMSGPQPWLFTTTWPNYGAQSVPEHTGNSGSFAGVDGSGSVSLTGITLTSPVIDVTTLINPRLRFYVFNNNTSSTLIADEQQLVVNVMNGATVVATYTWPYGQNFSAWQEIDLPFTKPSSNLINITFTVSKGSGLPFYDDMIIDDVCIEEIPQCPWPNTLVTSNITATTANLNWINGGSESKWDVLWGPHGFNPASAGTLISGLLAHPYNLNPPLSPNTQYDWYVRADCGGTKSVSPWAGPATFKTTCSAITTLPWAENFDAMPTVGLSILPDCWKWECAGGTPWYSGNAASITYNDPCSTPNYVYVSWSPSSTIKSLITPGFTLTGGTSYDFSFKWVGDAYSGWDGSVEVNTAQTETGATALGTPFVANGTTTTTTCIPQTYTYVPAANGTYYFVIKVLSNAVPYYLGFDDFSLTLTPPCSAPASLTASPGTITCDVGWTGPASAVSWDIEYGLHLFVPTGVPSAGYSGVGNPATITGLTPATSYDYYVRGNCAGMGYGPWAGPMNFTTLCLKASLPLCESFSGSTLPVCWSHQLSGAITSEHWLISNSSVAGGSPYEAEATYSPGQGAVETDQDRLVAPVFNPAGAGAINVTFKQMLNDYAAGINDVWIKLQYSYDKLTWTDAWSYAGGLGNSIPAQTKSVVIPVTGSPSKMYVAWTLAGYTYDINFWYVDDICIAAALADDVGTSSIGLAGVVPPTTPVTPTATVMNYGSNTETFDVTMTITDGYSSTKTVTALGPGLGTTVTFDSWTPVLGNYTVQVCTNLSGDLDPLNDCMSQQVSVQPMVKIYACVAYDPSAANPVGPAWFYNLAPGTITSLAAGTSTNFIGAGTWAAGVWYGSEYYDSSVPSGGGWYTIDPTTGAMTLIANIAMGFTGIAYDHTNNIMYGMNFSASSTNDLYTIVPATGVATLIGTVTALAGDLAIDIGYSGDGFVYANCIGTDHLYKIDPVTLAATDLGATGFDGNYAQGMGYDYTTSTMFLAAYNYTTSAGQLRTANLTTGAATLIGNFQGNAEIDGVAIPYTSSKVLNLTSTFLEGLYAGEGAMTQAYDDYGPHFLGDTADAITVELHNSGSYGTIEYTAAAALSISGTSTVAIPADKSGSYYLTIKNRNSIETTSADPVDFSGAVIPYSFNPLSQSYGPNEAVFIDGTAAIFSGDENQDGIVDGGDLSDIGNDAAFAVTGYIVTDLTGDGLVDASDLSICGNNAAAAVMLNTP